MKLVLSRHGQSEWNLSNRFTGWVDVDLTAQGVEEAIAGGKLLKEKGILVRHFNKDRISNWCRVSIGTKESIEALISKTKEILGGTV